METNIELVVRKEAAFHWKEEAIIHSVMLNSSVFVCGYEHIWKAIKECYSAHWFSLAAEGNSGM